MDAGEWWIGKNGYDVAFPTEGHDSSSFLAENINAESWVLSRSPNRLAKNKAVESVAF